MPARYLRIFGRLATVLDDNLSISLLLRNFFVAWHRDRTVFGFIFGMVIKILYLPFALVPFVLILILYIVFILSWLILPIGTIIFIIMSLVKK